MDPFRKIPAAVFIFAAFILINSNKVMAVETKPTEEMAEKALLRRSITVESNEIEGWPDGPINGAESAILMDVDTGVILYEKNIHEQLYPASTTKLLTALLVIENTSMDEIVTFSRDAVWNIDRGSSHLAIDVGEKITVKDCLYGLLLGSANEVAYALAEHVGGDLDSFVKMMNERALALGCKDTHFSNANGLPREDHYTSAYDLALISKECFSNETLTTIAGTTHYTMAPTNLQPEERKLENHHLMLPGFKYENPYVIAGKTGYTQVARQTLVTCGESDGMRLVCVIMREESPDQFSDTAALLDYGFSSFKLVNIADNENRYDLDSSNTYNTDVDILGNSRPIISIDPQGKVLIPGSMEISDLETQIEYDDDPKGPIAVVSYYVDGNYVGQANIEYATAFEGSKEFSDILSQTVTDGQSRTLVPDRKVVYVNVRLILIVCIAFIAAVFIIFTGIDLVKKLLRDIQRGKFGKRRRYKKRSENRFM